MSIETLSLDTILKKYGDQLESEFTGLENCRYYYIMNT